MQDDEQPNFMSDENETTDPDFRNIPTDIIPPTLVQDLWPHQYQIIYKCLEAEYKPPIVNEEGEVFYSRSGLICLSTGVGKTAAILGVCNYNVEDSKINFNLSSSSLTTIKLRRAQRININVSVICASDSIITDAWVKDIQRYYPKLGYYRFPTINEFGRSVLSSPEYTDMKYQNDRTKLIINDYFNSLEQRTINQEEFEIMMYAEIHEDIKTHSEKNEYFNKLDLEEEETFKRLIYDKLFEIISNPAIRILFISTNSFHFLFDFFKKCTVDRIIIDEPQDVVITKQENFRDYIVDKRFKKVKKLTDKIVPYCEESPARFLWCITATPERISDNTDKHYFNNWISKNDYTLIDYITNTEEGRLFPELISRYIIKFPYSYILESNPQLKYLIHEYVLNIKPTKEIAILAGALGEEFDDMLQNNDLQGIIDKLNVDGGNIENIFQTAVTRLNIDIRKHETDINNYKPGTPQHVIDTSRRKLEEEKENLRELQNKIERHQGYVNRENDCCICQEVLDPNNKEKSCVAHMKCMNGFHMECVVEYAKHQKDHHLEVTCPMCKQKLVRKDLIPFSRDDEIKANDSNKFTSKMQALDFCLGQMQRTVIDRNGNQSNVLLDRRKVLLFVEFSANDNNTLDDIIRLCQNKGFNVRLPFNGGTIPQLAAKYHSTNGCKVKNPGPKNKINIEINKFRESNDRYVWIFRSAKEASGLNFEFVDTSIEFSLFKSHKQIIGRSMRMNRITEVDSFILKYE